MGSAVWPGTSADRVGLIDGGTNGTSLAAAIAQANAVGGGQVIQLGKGTYRLTAAQSLDAVGISIVGNGPGSTFVELDDAGGLAGGNAFTVNGVLQARFAGFTCSATAARTAGAAILVKGVNNITATPAQRTGQYRITDVDMQDQFNGVVINDGAASAGAWGGIIEGGEWIRFSAGGVGLWINTPHGGQQYIHNLKLYNGDGTADASRALAGVRYQGGNDIELVNVNEVYFQHGLLIDPPNGQVANATMATACLWDSNTRASVKVAPAAGGTVQGVQLNGGWGKTDAATSLPTVQIDGGTVIKVLNGEYWGTYIAVQVQNATKVIVKGNDCSGATGAGIYFKGTASDFICADNIVGSFGSAPPIGIQIDAGADHYSVTGNVVRECTTKITNTPGTAAGQRIVQDNVTA